MRGVTIPRACGRHQDADGVFIMTRPTVAVVGAGISGMTAAYVLQQEFNVEVFEAADRTGGHSDTREARSTPVDVGFMTYGEVSYPTVTRLLGELGVASRTVNLSTAVSCTDCGFSDSPGLPFGSEKLPERPPTVSARTWDRFITDMTRFPKLLTSITGPEETSQTLGDFLQHHRFSEYFTRHFLYARLSPWLLAQPRYLDGLPIQFMLNTFGKHDLFGPGVLASWRVVDGGSREYLTRIAGHVKDLHLSTTVSSVRRTGQGVEIRDSDGNLRKFDKAVIATHATQALEMLADPSPMERELLAAFRYSSFEVALHDDPSVLKHNDSAVNLQVSCATHVTQLCDVNLDVTLLQRLGTPERYIVTYGPHHIDPDRIVYHATYEHPIIDSAAAAAQRRLPKLSGPVLAFAGSYHGDSFHEDACLSGVRSAECLGAKWE
jgi:predicted NAD/FAD-binding protein